MAWPKRTVQFRPVGLVADMPPFMVPDNHWTMANNVYFRSGGFARRILGSRAAYDPPSTPPLHFINHQVEASNFWVYVGEDEQHAVVADTHHDITLSGLGAQVEPHLHSLFSFNGVIVHNNFLDPPMFWANNPLSEFEVLPGWPSGERARRIVPHLYHMFAFDFTTGSGVRHTLVRWSDSAEPGTVPGTWTPAADNDAGFVELADTDGPVIAAAGLGRTLLLYKRNSVYAADFVEDDRVYTFRPLFHGRGALTPRSVVDIGRRHIVLGENDIYMTDGTDVQSIVSHRMKNRIFNQLDADNLLNAFLFYHAANSEVWVCIPTLGNVDCNRAFVYNVTSDAWSERDIPLSTHGAVGVITDLAPSGAWDDSTGTWDEAIGAWDQADLSKLRSLILGSRISDGEFRLMDSQDAEAITARIGKHDMHFGQPERLKAIRRVHILATEGSGPLTVRVGARMTPQGPITWTAFDALNPPDQILNTFQMGRYISVEIEGSSENVWGIAGFDLELEMRGYH